MGRMIRCVMFLMRSFFCGYGGIGNRTCRRLPDRRRWLLSRIRFFRSEAERIVSEYFAGIKRIVFLGDRAVYERLAAAFNAGFKRRNIEPSVNGLQIVYDSHGKDVARGCPWGVCAADSFCPSSLVRGAAAGVDLSFESQCRCHEEAASFACLKATMSIYLGQRKGWRSREYSCPVEWQVMEDHWVVKFEFVRSMQEKEGVL